MTIVCYSCNFSQWLAKSGGRPINLDRYLPVTRSRGTNVSTRSIASIIRHKSRAREYHHTHNALRPMGKSQSMLSAPPRIIYLALFFSVVLEGQKSSAIGFFDKRLPVKIRVA